MGMIKAIAMNTTCKATPIPDHISVLRHRPSLSLLVELPGPPGQHLAFHRLRVHPTDLGSTPIESTSLNAAMTSIVFLADNMGGNLLE